MYIIEVDKFIFFNILNEENVLIELFFDLFYLYLLVIGYFLWFLGIGSVFFGILYL